MFSYLGGSRWDVPWGRGQLGGWESFLDQMQYFGYVMPSLAALVSRRAAASRRRRAIFVFLTGIMLLFLGQGGGRRIIGVTLGAAILVWIQQEEKLTVRQTVDGGRGGDRVADV